MDGFDGADGEGVGSPHRPLGVVAVETLRGGRGQEAFYSTCAEATAEQVLTWYAMRWSIEVTRPAAQRTAPIAMLLYSLIVLWFARTGHHDWQPLHSPWYTAKTHSSFADMLRTLRRQSLRHSISAWAPTGPGARKIQQLLENISAMAT